MGSSAEQGLPGWLESLAATEISAANRVGCIEGCVGEVSPAEIGEIQLATAEPGPNTACASQHCFAQICCSQADAIEASAAEISTAQVGPHQVASAQIHAAQISVVEENSIELSARSNGSAGLWIEAFWPTGLAVVEGEAEICTFQSAAAEIAST